MVETVQVKGVSEALRFIRARGKDIHDGADAGVFQAATFVQSEVQESIIGKRAEMRSVDTGRFGNSINVDKLKELQYVVFPKRSTYPGTFVTTEEVAKFLEFGTSRIAARSHFRNTKSRTKNKVQSIVDNAIKKA